MGESADCGTVGQAGISLDSVAGLPSRLLVMAVRNLSGDFPKPETKMAVCCQHSTEYAPHKTLHYFGKGFL